MMSPLSTITMSDAGIPRPQLGRNSAQYRTNDKTRDSSFMQGSHASESSATTNRPLVVSEKAG
jgi:hypothetical protein